jgi:hypothetical protein
MMPSLTRQKRLPEIAESRPVQRSRKLEFHQSNQRRVAHLPDQVEFRHWN